MLTRLYITHILRKNRKNKSLNIRINVSKCVCWLVCWFALLSNGITVTARMMKYFHFNKKMTLRQKPQAKGREWVVGNI